MSTIEITHTHAEGTMLAGSRKGDGVFEIVKSHGFRYFPSIKAIGIQQSRDQVAKRWKINSAAEALRAAGHEVTVEIDDTPRDRGTVLADQADRLDDRRDRLEARAEKHAAASDAAYQHSHRLIEHIPPGQPVLVGHHSERGHRRTLDRSWNAMGKSVAENKAAEETSRRAAVVGRQAARSERPDVTARRIKKTQTDLARVERLLADPKFATSADNYRADAEARRALLTERLTYDQAAVAAAVEAGHYTVWDKTNVHVGDVVYSSWAGARIVQKVNRTTVHLVSGYSWPDVCPFVDIHKVVCPHDKPAAVEPQRLDEPDA